MAGVTNPKSPFQDKSCVLGSAVIGAAIGRGAGVDGVIVGAAVGAIIGMAVCSRDSISKPLGNYLDFGRAINDLSSNSEAQAKVVNNLVEQGHAEDHQSAAVMLSYAISETNKDSQKVYQSLPGTILPPTGQTAHGLNHLARKASGAIASVT